METAIAAALLLALSASAPADLAAEEGAAVSTATASDPAPRGVHFYSDLGPDRIDVSGYPEKQRQNYGVYARACSRCHALARSINAPYASRGWWEFYMTSMRVRGRVSGRPFSREEILAVLDFLDYDSRVRKIERAAEFEKAAEDLKRRYNAYVDRRMSDLQSMRQPQLFPQEPPKR